MTFSFHGLLNDEEIGLLKQQNSILSLNCLFFEHLHIGVAPNQELFISCLGKVGLSFKTRRRSHIHIDFTSGYDELAIPFPDRGCLKVAVDEEHHRNLKEAIQSEKPTSIYNANISHIGFSTVIALKFFGDSVDTTLDQAMEISEEYLETFRLEDDSFPKIVCNSIEFIVIEMEDKNYTILMLENGGFRVFLHEQLSDLYSTLKSRRSGLSNLVLHHEISYNK
ncbi:MAG: hypothetical protein IT269_02395 [Saprospiraceae bacterium]|nr:hypothetical protein [Saprospiraceae bacterium]